LLQDEPDRRRPHCRADDGADEARPEPAAGALRRRRWRRWHRPACRLALLRRSGIRRRSLALILVSYPGLDVRGGILPTEIAAGSRSLRPRRVAFVRPDRL